MAAAFHWRFNSLGPIETTQSKHSPWLMPFHSCRENADFRAIVLTVCWVTVVMTWKQSGKVCVTEASSLFLRNATPNTAAGWVDGAGLSNERLLG